MLKVVLFLVFAFSGTNFSQVINVGSCPEVKVVQGFDSTQYLGKWYEYSRYFAIFELATKCNSAEYSLSSDGNVKVVNKAVSEITGSAQEIVGSAKVVRAGEGELSVHFPSSFSEANYYVIDTDYKNWAAVFSCRNLGIGMHAKFAWLLTRSQNPSDVIINQAEDAFKAQNISTSILTKTKQEQCQ